MTTSLSLCEGQILTGAHFPEPVRVETVTSLGPAKWEIGVVGVQSERFRRVTLSDEDRSELVWFVPNAAVVREGNPLLRGDVFEPRLVRRIV